MALPPTSTNLLKHVLQAQLQVMLWKVADHQAPPDESVDTTQFGWDIKNSIPIPTVSQGAPAPPELVDVIQCQCKAQGKKCSTAACNCHKEHLACTSYCNCCGEDECCNLHTRSQSAQAGDEEDVEEAIEMVDFDFEENEMDDEDFEDVTMTCTCTSFLTNFMNINFYVRHLCS